MDLTNGHIKGAAMEEHGCQRNGKLNRNDVIEKDSLHKGSTELDSSKEKVGSCNKAPGWDKIPSRIQEQKANSCLSEISVNEHEIGVENSGIVCQKQDLFLESKNKLPNSESRLDDIEKGDHCGMSSDCINLTTNRKDVFVNVKNRVKGAKDTSKTKWNKTVNKTLYTRDIENISNGANFDQNKFSVENEACSLFEGQLQELEKQTSEKCLKFKFTKKRNKGKKQNPIDTGYSFEKHYKTKKVSCQNHENTKLGRKKIQKDKSNEKHKNDGRKHVTTSNKLYRNSSGKKPKKYLQATNGISLSSSVNGRIQTENTSVNGRIQAENSRHFVDIKKLTEISEKTLNFHNRCYRLQSSQWNASGKCALRLLKRKYLSVRTLFYKEPVVYLEQLNVNGEVKMIGENFEVISMWEAETDTAVCSDDASREASSEEGSLVDPRVMSLSRTLESGHNGKIGVEKTFKNSSCKNSQAKTKVCFKLQAVGNVKKPLVQKPDWSKLKEKLKEVNAKKALKKKQAEVGIGKDNKRIPVLKNNPCFNLKNHANPKLISETVKSNKNSCTIPNSFEPIIQERKRELEKLCPVSDAVEDVAQQEVNDLSLSEKTLEEFQKDLDASDIDFKMDEYSIEVCTESTDEDQSKDPSVDRDLPLTDNSDTENCQMEDILNSGQDSAETRLTVTSGIIPNLYVTDGLPAEVLEDESLSPPVLQREGVDEGEVIALNQYQFVIKDDLDSGNGTILITSNDLTIDNCSAINKEEDNPKISEHSEISTVSSDVEKSQTIDNTPVLHVDSVTSYENAQNIPEKIKNLDNSAPLSHLSLTDSSDNVRDSEASSDVNSSSSFTSHVTSSRSADAQNYPEMTEKVCIESIEYSKQGKANSEDLSPETQTDITDPDEYDKRSSPSLSPGKEGPVHVQAQQKVSQGQAQKNTIGDMHIDGQDKLPVAGSFVFDKSGQPLEIIAVTTLSHVNKVFGDLPTLTWINSQSPLKENINANKAEHQKKKVSKKDKAKPEKIYKKRKKSLERKYSLENDSEELPKISPPKRRPRPVAKASTKTSDYLSEERLMQDFPKHNWLFNKYSSLSTSAASASNDVNAADPKAAKESSEIQTKLASTANTVTMRHERRLENTSRSLSQEEMVEPSSAAQFNTLSNMAPAVLSSSSQPVTPSTTAPAYSLNSPSVHQSSFFSRNNTSIPVSSKLDHQKATTADSEKSSKANMIGSSFRNHSASEPVSPELGHNEKGSLKTLENSAAKMDVLKYNFHHDTINLHYDEGSSEQVNCGSTGHHDLKMDEEIDKNASRPFLTYQSLKKQGDSKFGLHINTNSCDKGIPYTVTKSVDFEKMETVDYCDTALQKADKNLDHHLRQQKHKSDIGSTSISQAYATSHTADKSSADMDITMLDVQANSPGNASHSDQEVVAMVTKEVEHRESVPQEVFSSSKPQSPETTTESSTVKKSSDSSSTVKLSDHLHESSLCGKMGAMEVCAAKQVPVETNGVNFRQKPSLPVLRVQPHLYKPPGTVRNTSPDPMRARDTIEVSAEEIPVSVGSTGNGSVPFSIEPSIARTQEDNNSVSQDNFAQNKGAVGLQSTSLSSISYSQSASNAQSGLESKTPGKLKIAEVAVPAMLGTFSNTRNNTGMVIPVQPIIQTTVSTAVTSGNITMPSLNSTASSNSISNQLVTNHNINLNSNDRTLLPDTGSPTPPSGHIPVNPPYVYHQQPAIIRVQTPTINSSGMFEINRLTQIPQTNQLYLLESDHSVIPISTASTRSAETSNQRVLATVQSAQEQPHIGQILSSSHIIFAQPVCARATQSSLTVVDNTSEVTGVKKIDCNSTTTSERVISAESESVGKTSSNLGNNSDDKQRVISGIVKNEESKSQEVEAATLSDEDEEFKRQMDELDKEIKRKEREHEEMRKKKQELLEKRRKAARCVQKVKSEEKQEENVVEGSTLAKTKLDEKDQTNTEEATLSLNMTVGSSRHSSVVQENKQTISDIDDKLLMQDSWSEEKKQNSKGSETDIKTDERNKRTITETNKASVEIEAGNKGLQDDTEDKDEDCFEGALVIDLSATSKDNGNSSRTAMYSCSPLTQVTFEGEVKSEIQAETHFQSTLPDYCMEEPSVEKHCDPTHEKQQVEVNTGSIEYIEDIGSINPFTGEIDNMESQYDIVSLDLSKKPANQIKADITATDILKESLHADNVPKMVANSTEKQSLEDDGSITDLSRHRDGNQDKDACKMVSEQDNGSLDLSVKPLCVFTFKKNDEITDTTSNFCLESNPENDSLTQMKEVSSQLRNSLNDTVQIMNTDKESMFGPASENVAEEDESKSMRTNMIASAASRDLSNTAVTGSDLDATLADLENHTLVRESQVAYRYSEGNVPLKQETSTDQFIENQGSESENPLCNENIVDKIPVVPNHIHTRVSSAPTYTGKKSVVGNQAVALVSDKMPVNTSLQPTQYSRSVHLRQPSPANQAPYRPNVQYRPTIHEQRHVGPLGFHSSEESIPPNQERVPGYHSDRASSSSFHSQGHYGTQEPQKVMKHVEPYDNTNPVYNFGLNNVKDDFQRSRGHPSGRQQAQRRSKEMYMEIEPAHMKPVPKKISKYAKPSPAHIQEVNMKEIFKKVNKSHCQVPLAVQQSGPYFRRRDPVFQAPGDQQSRTKSMNDKPKPAHSQKPFSIAGQLIVTRKKACKRNAKEKIVGPSPKRFLSVPPSTPPPQLEEIQRSSSATPDISYSTDDGHIEVALPSQRSSLDDIISPTRAHSSTNNYEGNHSITTDQVLKPPLSFRGDCKDSFPKASDIIDLTIVESPKVEASDYINSVSEGQISTETVVQTELNAALAKRQNHDSHLSASMKVPSQSPVSHTLTHVVPEVCRPPRSKPPPPSQYGNLQVRMPAPQSRPTRLRQPDYSRPRQVLAPVPIDRPRLPEPVPHPSISQVLMSHHSKRVPAHAYLQEQEPVLKRHHSPQQAPFQSVPRDRAAHEQQQFMTYRPARNVGPSAMTELSNQTADTVLPHESMYQRNPGFHPYGKDSFHSSPPDIPQPMPGHRLPSSDKGYQQFMIRPPKKQEVEPSYGPSQRHLQPQTSPRNYVLSPSSPHERLPPSPRGDVQQNWSQIQKMQQIRANHLRNRESQNRQPMVAREMDARPGYSNMVRPGMVENFIQGQVQDPGQKYQPSSKQHPMQQTGLQPHKTIPMQSIETRHQTNQFLGPHSMINQYGQAPQTANQMATKKLQVSPPASTRYYHLGPPEAQFITTVNQMPPTHPNQHSGQNRAISTSQTTYQSHTKQPNIIQGFQNQPVRAHSMRNSEQVIHQGQHQYLPQKSWHGSSPLHHKLASTYPVSNLSVHQGHGQAQMRESSGQHTQGAMLTKVPQDFPGKIGQDLEQEDVPHLQQVNGTCILCGRYSLYLCSSCKKIWYCSPECQLKHWQTHANECKGPAG